ETETSGTVRRSANYSSDRPLSPLPRARSANTRRNRQLGRLRLILFGPKPKRRFALEQTSFFRTKAEKALRARASHILSDQSRKGASRWSKPHSFAPKPKRRFALEQATFFRTKAEKALRARAKRAPDR